MDTTNAYETYRHRATTLRALVDDLERNRATELPWTPELAAAFSSSQDLLVALHGLWTRRLATRIDLALEIGDELPVDEVAAAWREVAADLPAVRRILDDHAHEPGLRASEEHEHRLIAVAAGYAAVTDPIAAAAPHGARLVRELRSATVPAQRGERLADRIGHILRWDASPARAQARMATR